MTFGGWTKVRELGEGGQGEVSLVVSPQRSQVKSKAVNKIVMALDKAGAAGHTSQQRNETATDLAIAITDYSRPDSLDELGALKVYKIPAGDEGERARKRFATEVKVLTDVKHPNLLRLIVADTSADWMITQYYEGETLKHDKLLFQNKPLEALTSFRGLVEGVAKLHEVSAVHRDIKPANIFVDGGRLVLGDFGIVFIEDNRHARMTETFERVGTRDWMPPWAHTGMRVDEVKPSFDVFSLGKVLWAMLSGMEMLQLWYFTRPRFDLTQLFPNTHAMHVINERILAIYWHA